MDTAGGTDDDLGAVLESLRVITGRGTTKAGVTFNIHKVANSDNDLLNLLSQFTSRSKDEGLALLNSRIDLLKSRDGEGSRLASTRLSLGNNIVALNDGNYSALLDSRRTLKPVGVDCREGDWSGHCWERDARCAQVGGGLTTSEKLRLEVHVIEINSLIANGLDVSCREEIMLAML